MTRNAKENNGFTRMFHGLLGKNIGGVEFDIELVVLWSCMYDRRLYFGNDRETLESIRTSLHLKKFKAATLLQKLIQAGVVKAELIVKNKGVKKGNEDKAPKRWRFIEIANPESYIKAKPKPTPQPKPAPKPVVPGAPAMPPQKEYDVYEDLEYDPPF